MSFIVLLVKVMSVIWLGRKSSNDFSLEHLLNVHIGYWYLFYILYFINPVYKVAELTEDTERKITRSRGQSIGGVSFWASNEVGKGKTD